MNTRAIRGLFFEHATRTWPFIAAALLVHLLYASIWLFDDARQYEVEPAAQVMTLFIAALGLIYSVADGERMTSEIPPRTLLLPVPTLLIVAVKFAWSALVIGVLSLIVHGTYVLITSEPRDPWYYYFIVAIVMFAIIQTIALAAGCLGDWSLGILFGAYVVLLTYVVAFSEDSVLLRKPITVALDVSFLLGMCLSLSWGVVHLRRTGRWDPDLLWPARARSRTRASAAEPAPFESAFAAQQWFEKRRMQRFFWIVFGFTVLVITIIDVSHSSELESQTLILGLIDICITLSYAFMLSALVAGIVMAFQNHRFQFGSISAFLYLRPMTSADLARARLSGTVRGMRVIVFSIAVILIVAAAAALLTDELTGSTLLSDTYGSRFLSGVYVLALATAWAWATYWTVNVCVALLLYAVFAVTVDWLDFVGVIQSESSAYSVGMVLASLLMLGIFVLAVARGHLSRRRAGGVAIAGLLLVATFWLFVNWNILSSPIDNWSLIFDRRLIPVVLFVLLPIATTPLTFHWARHR